MVGGIGALAAATLLGTVAILGPSIGPVLNAIGATPRPTSTRPSPSAVVFASVSPSAPPSEDPSLVPSLEPSDPASASPTPAASSGPFRMDLYRSGAFTSELTDVWCLPAAMQTSANIMNLAAGKAADRTKARQKRLFDLARSLAPAPDKAAEPEGWAMGLIKLGYGHYKVSVQPSLKAAITVAARAVRATGRPAGLMVWRGAHSWVMSGFTATADPAVTSHFTVTAVYIEDVWYPRISRIWGASRRPDSLVPVNKLPEDFKPWKRPQRAYPEKDGRFVIVIPTA